VRANAEGVPHITDVDFPSSGADLVTALSKELGFPFFGIKKDEIAARVPATHDEGTGLSVLQSILALMIM